MDQYSDSVNQFHILGHEHSWNNVSHTLILQSLTLPQRVKSLDLPQILQIFLRFFYCNAFSSYIKFHVCIFMPIGLRVGISNLLSFLPLKEVIVFRLCANLLNNFVETAVARLFLLIDCHLVFQAYD